MQIYIYYCVFLQISKFDDSMSDVSNSVASDRWWECRPPLEELRREVAPRISLVTFTLCFYYFYIIFIIIIINTIIILISTICLVKHNEQSKLFLFISIFVLKTTIHSKIYANFRGAVVIDVRSKEDFQTVHFPESVHFNTQKLEDSAVSKVCYFCKKLIYF